MAMVLADTLQRLPVYLLIDASASMAGAPITAIQEGLQMFKRTITDDPHCRETVFVSVIRFSSDAEQIVPLIPAVDFNPPPLSAWGGSALSRGIYTLRLALRREVLPKGDDYLGDYKPLVFLLTDGQLNPGDPWRVQSSLLFANRGPRPGLLVAIGTGPGADPGVLGDLAPGLTYMLADLDPSRLRALFQWIANSTIAAARSSVYLSTPGTARPLAPAPPNLFEQKP